MSLRWIGRAVVLTRSQGTATGSLPQSAQLHLLTHFPSVLYLVPLYASNEGFRLKEATPNQKGF